MKYFCTAQVTQHTIENMNELTLHPGPRLLRISCGGASPLQPQDVTAHAVEFLFSRLELAPNLRLSDLVALFERCPALHTVWRRFHSEALCADAALGPLPDAERSDLTFLELRQIWSYNTHLREYSDVRDLELIGVGHAPQTAPDYRPEADGFYRYSLLGTSIRAVLTLPIRMSDQVRVFEADPYAVRHDQQISTVRNSNLTLGELLQVLLWELTWFGSPETTESAVDEMAEQFAQENDWTTFTAEEFWQEHFGADDKQAFQVVFESMGSLSAYALGSAVGQIPDGVKARRWLGQTLGKTVRFQPAFRELTGRGLRQAIAQAKNKVVSDAQ